MLTHYYDIESLPNVFSLSDYHPETRSVTIYVLDDDDLMGGPEGVKEGGWFYEKLVEGVHAANKETFADGHVKLICLNKAEIAIPTLLHDFGCEFTQLARLTPNVPPELVSTSVPEIASHVKVGIHPSLHLRRDTDADFDETTDYLLAGYNSYNYDTTMLSWYLSHIVQVEAVPDTSVAPAFDQKTNQYIYPMRYGITLHPITARTMRNFNDTLFSSRNKKRMADVLRSCTNDDGTQVFLDDVGEDGPETAQNDRSAPERQIRDNWLRTGRYVDVARLNEKQARVALKRLLGMLGYQILESNFDEVHTPEALVDLLAYNVSDVVNLENLLHDKVYEGGLELKSSMLDTYPELVYKNGVKRPDNVRYNRLYRDSTSQQLSARSLCPDGNLHDKETVSFVYPDPEKALASGITPRDVLDESIAFFCANIERTTADDETKAQALADLDHVWQSYSAIRGTNYDDSADYHTQYPAPRDENSPEAQRREVHELKKTPGLPRCVFYYGPDGKPTSCFATFSVGGLHGAEYNKALFEADLAEWRTNHDDSEFAKGVFGADSDGAIACRLSVKRLKDPIPLDFPSGRTLFTSDLLASGSTKTHAEWREFKKPVLFDVGPDGSSTLSKRYPFTSFGKSNHDDFSSYYPGLLRQMNVFKNELVEDDRYGRIYDGKQEYGRIMKDKSRPAAERAMAKQKRGGVKLILNTASGAGDATFDNPVRMNNNIIAMRCIGQMFTWRIAQAQAFEGALIPSTNTDGLYTFMDEDKNNESLAREAKVIGVDIDPEVTYIISKDANNRVEWHENADGTYEVTEVAGYLAAYHGPNPEKSLNHPAIRDWALTEYLIRTARTHGAAGIAAPFDATLGRELLESARDQSLDVEGMQHALIMFQNIVASNPASMSYVFAMRDEDKEPRILQHYNRVFYVIGEDMPEDDVAHLHMASASVITAAVIRSREKRGDKKQQNDATATKVLRANMVDIDGLYAENRETKVKTVTDLDEGWDVLIENHAIIGMDPTRMRHILDHLDMDAYLELLCESYEHNWRNHLPGGAPATVTPKAGPEARKARSQTVTEA